jgi:hypothetical protein
MHPAAKIQFEHGLVNSHNGVLYPKKSDRRPLHGGGSPHIHNLKTPEFEALTTTYCARIHRARRQRGGFARRLVEAGLKAKSKA